MRAYNYIFQRIVIALRHRFFDGDDSAVAGLAGLMRRAPAFPEIAVEMLFSFCTAEVLIEPVRNENAYHLLTTTNYMILSVSHDFFRFFSFSNTTGEWTRRRESSCGASD